MVYQETIISYNHAHNTKGINVCKELLMGKNMSSDNIRQGSYRNCLADSRSQKQAEGGGGRFPSRKKNNIAFVHFLHILLPKISSPGCYLIPSPFLPCLAMDLSKRILAATSFCHCPIRFLTKETTHSVSGDFIHATVYNKLSV